ncbi:MAG: hypothetical protein ABH846_03300 [Patescibacteria group bacterium]
MSRQEDDPFPRCWRETSAKIENRSDVDSQGIGIDHVPFILAIGGSPDFAGEGTPARRRNYG